MEILGAAQFPDDETVAFYWPAGKTETPAHINVNGHQFKVLPNTDYLAATSVFEVLDHSGYLIVLLDDPVADTESPAAPAAESGDGGGEGSGGANPAPDSFDADAIIAGNVEEVKARLAALTPEQLAAVSQAELDREVPRKGVAEAIAALTPPAE